jgi:hypothetical protein
LFWSRRVSDDNELDKEILEAVRVGEQISDAHVDKLLSLHLDAIKSQHGPEMVKEIEAKSVYLFWTNEKRIQHNIKNLVAMNGPNNPTSIIKPKSKGGKNGKAVNSHFQGDFPGFCLLCNGCKVALQGRNFNPLWGLHNGACGTLVERIHDTGKNPNNDDFPLYVVVDFPLYGGPIWDQDNPTVRITIMNCFEYHLCLTFIFLYSIFLFLLSQFHAQKVAAQEHSFL